MVNNSNGFFFNARKNVHLSKVKVLLTQSANKAKSESTDTHTHTDIKTDQKSQDS